MGQGTQMDFRSNDQRPELIPMAVAALVAVASVVALVLLDFAPTAQGSGDGMITSAVLARAGAIASPSEKPVIAAPETIAVSRR